MNDANRSTREPDRNRTNRVRDIAFDAQRMGTHAPLRRLPGTRIA